MNQDGSLPTVIYANQQVNRYPSWMAPLGDVLYVAETLRPYGFEEDLSAMPPRLLAGQDESGCIQTARGFAAQASNRLPALPDLRDVQHVVGWCDKAFRYLASQIDSDLSIEVEALFETSDQPLTEMTFESACIFQGKPMHYRETPKELEITAGGPICYRWRKGQKSQRLNFG